MSLLTLALQQTQRPTWLNCSAEAIAASEDVSEVARSNMIEQMLLSMKKFRRPVSRAWVIRQTGLNDDGAKKLVEDLVRTRKLVACYVGSNRVSWTIAK